jgi:hypothetical protein
MMTVSFRAVGASSALDLEVEMSNANADYLAEKIGLELKTDLGTAGDIEAVELSMKLLGYFSDADRDPYVEEHAQLLGKLCRATWTEGFRFIRWG